jgi:hypothetical protein
MEVLVVAGVVVVLFVVPRYFRSRTRRVRRK